ncbi:MAG: hypothetical protein AABX51_03810 [Nanoarchaeota archaeon]
MKIEMIIVFLIVALLIVVVSVQAVQFASLDSKAGVRAAPQIQAQQQAPPQIPSVPGAGGCGV